MCARFVGYSCITRKREEWFNRRVHTLLSACETDMCFDARSFVWPDYSRKPVGRQRTDRNSRSRGETLYKFNNSVRIYHLPLCAIAIGEATSPPDHTPLLDCVSLDHLGPNLHPANDQASA